MAFKFIIIFLLKGTENIGQPGNPAGIKQGAAPIQSGQGGQGKPNQPNGGHGINNHYDDIENGKKTEFKQMVIIDQGVQNKNRHHDQVEPIENSDSQGKIQL